MACLEKYNEENLKQYDELFSKAGEAIDNKQYEKAIEFFKTALEIFPDKVQAMGEICICYGELEDYDAIIELSNKALKISQHKFSTDNIGRFYSHIGYAYKNKELYEPAIRNYLHAIANKPKYLNNYQELGICYLLNGNYEEAVDVFNTIIERDPDYAKEYDIEEKIKQARGSQNHDYPEIYHARLYYKYSCEENDEMAYKECFEVLAINPHNVLALYGLLKLERKKGNIEKAIDYGKQAINALNNAKDSKDNFLYMAIYMELIQIYNDVDDFENSAEYAKKFNGYYFMSEAEDYIKQNNKDLAIKTCEDVMKEYEDNFDIIDKAIKIEVGYERFPQAMSYIERGIRFAVSKGKGEKASEYYKDMADCYMLIGNYDAAINAYNKAIDLTDNISKKFEYNYQKASCYQKMRNLDKVQECYFECLDYEAAGAVDKFDVESKLVMLRDGLNPDSDFCLSRQHLRMAEQLCKEAWDFKNPQAPEAIAKLKQAESEARLALFIIPRDLRIMALLTRCLISLRDPVEAFNVAYEAYMVSKRVYDETYSDIFCYALGNYYLFVEKDYKKALDSYRMSDLYHPNDATYLFMISICYKYLKNYDMALYYFQKSQMLSPNDPDIEKQIAECMEQMKSNR